MTVKTNEIKQVFLLKKMDSFIDEKFVYVLLTDGSIHLVFDPVTALNGDEVRGLSGTNVRSIFAGEHRKELYPNGIKVFKRMKGFNKNGWDKIVEYNELQYR